MLQVDTRFQKKPTVYTKQPRDGSHTSKEELREDALIQHLSSECPGLEPGGCYFAFQVIMRLLQNQTHRTSMSFLLSARFPLV